MFINIEPSERLRLPFKILPDQERIKMRDFKLPQTYSFYIDNDLLNIWDSIDTSMFNYVKFLQEKKVLKIKKKNRKRKWTKQNLRQLLKKDNDEIIKKSILKNEKNKFIASQINLPYQYVCNFKRKMNVSFN